MKTKHDTCFNIVQGLITRIDKLEEENSILKNKIHQNNYKN